MIDYTANMLADELMRAVTIAENINVYPTVTDIQRLDGAVFRANNLLAMLHATQQTRVHLPLPACHVQRKNNTLLITAPYLPRKKAQLHESYVTCGALLDQAIPAIHANAPILSKVDITITAVYSTSTPKSHILDPDNIAIKRLVDNVMLALNLDDGEDNLRLTISTIITDRIQPATYITVRERSNDDDKRINELEDLIYGKDQ